MEKTTQYPLKSSWVMWENLKANQQQNKALQQKESEFMDNNISIIKISDLHTFSQFWHNTKFSKPFEIFLNLEGMITKVTIEGVQRQIEALAMFKDNVKPAWEDPSNVKGSEFRYTMILKTPEDLQLAEKIWEQSIIEIISDENAELMKNLTGIRIADKSMSKTSIKIRFEYWMNLNYENPENMEEMDKIKDLLQHIFARILNQNARAINIAYNSHIDVHK